jgi:hypothetical protein
MYRHPRSVIIHNPRILNRLRLRLGELKRTYGPVRRPAADAS